MVANGGRWGETRESLRGGGGAFLARLHRYERLQIQNLIKIQPIRTRAGPGCQGEPGSPMLGTLGTLLKLLSSLSKAAQVHSGWPRTLAQLSLWGAFSSRPLACRDPKETGQELKQGIPANATFGSLCSAKSLRARDDRTCSASSCVVRNPARNKLTLKKSERTGHVS